jgi:hypothetical protein
MLNYLDKLVGIDPVTRKLIAAAPARDKHFNIVLERLESDRSKQVVAATPASPVLLKRRRRRRSYNLMQTLQIPFVNLRNDKSLTVS